MMTDEEIIKALECCTDCKCKECPCYNKETDGCKEIDEKDILDLINRQKAEIEILTGERDCLAKMEHDNLYEQTQKIRKAKSEAIKEFAERLKEYSYHPISMPIEYKVVPIEAIDSLLKEMVGDVE